MTGINDMFNKVFPSAEELWRRADADICMINVNGEMHDLPLFGLGVDGFKQIGRTKELHSKSPGHRKIGSEVLAKLDVNGVPHLARVMIPDDQLRHDEATDFAFNRSTAFTTSIHGYAERGSKSIVARTHRPFVQTGAVYSAASPIDLWKLPKTTWEARNQSIFAQSEARVVMHKFLAGRFGLPEKYAILGDSMSAINQPAMYAYDFMHGQGVVDDELTTTESKIIGFHAKGRSVVQKLEAHDLPRVGIWVAKTLLGGFAASACLAREGKLHTVRGSVSSNPQFHASAFTGTLRALTSGEAGHALNFIPHDAGGLEVLYGNDDLSDVETIRGFFTAHPNVHEKVIPGGTHGAIFHSLADKGRTEWAVKLSDTYDEQNGRLTGPDWRYINKVPEINPIANFVETVRMVAS